GVACVLLFHEMTHRTESARRVTMMRTISSLKGQGVAATDGDIGSVQDIYFDDMTWTVRYFVVDTGTWLPGRQVLLSPMSLRGVNADGKVVVPLSRGQVEQSPSVDTDKPVNRQYEMQYAQYYGYPYYWTGASRWGDTALPAQVMTPTTTWPPEV